VVEHYHGSIRADIWVFILSVLGRSNVLLSPPEPNFTNLLTQYLAVTRVLMNIFRTRSRDVTDQCQIMLGMLPVEHHVFLRKVRFLLRFKNSDNLICSLFLDNASMQ